jgi:peptidoglycan/xylan/chitin deacetylase (PgdA/CDA1 family)
MIHALAMITGAFVVVVAGLFLRLVCRESRRPRVVCLMYHRFCTPEEYDRAVGTERIFKLPVDRFDRQIAWLKQKGYAFVSPEQVARFTLGEQDLPQPAVMITFDDGSLSVHDLALPVLRRHEAAGMAFVTTDPTSYVFQSGDGGQRRMTDDELRDLAGTIQVGSHAVTHRPLRALSEEDICQELSESRRQLETVLGTPVEYLAIPGNWFDERVMRVAREVGYRAVWCSNPGSVQVGAGNYALCRINVEGPLTLPRFISAIGPIGIAQRQMVAWVKRMPSRLLGPRFWLPLRKLLLACIPGRYVSTGRMIAALGVFVAVALGVVAWLLSILRK